MSLREAPNTVVQEGRELIEKLDVAYGVWANFGINTQPESSALLDKAIKELARVHGDLVERIENADSDLSYVSIRVEVEQFRSSVCKWIKRCMGEAQEKSRMQTHNTNDNSKFFNTVFGEHASTVREIDTAGTDGWRGRQEPPSLSLGM